MQGFRSHYPFLASGTVMTLSPRGGCLAGSSPSKPLFVAPFTAASLTHLDGTSTLDEVLSRAYREAATEEELLCLTAELAALFRGGLLAFEPEPQCAPTTIKGSFDVFYPENLQVELTAACNLRCSYCYRDALYGREPERLTTDALLGILAALHERGLRSVELTGGEPFMHPEFARIVEFCAARFHLIGLLTNGSLVTERSVQPMLPHTAKFVVSVSLDSHRAEVHDRRRGMQGAFARTVNGIRLLAASGFLTRVSMSVDEENWPDIEETLLLARSLGAFAFAYAPILPFGRGKQGFRMWQATAVDVVEQEKALQQKYRGFLDLLNENTIEKLHQPGGCGAGHRVYAMDPCGNVRPCVTFATDEAIAGNLARESPEQVFGGELARRFAGLLAPDAASCGDCRWAFFCRNCVYRATVASEWIGREHCTWLGQEPQRQWLDAVERRSTATR